MDYGAGMGQAFGLAVGWALIGLVASIPTLLLFRWWSEGIIGGAEGAGLLALYVVMFALLMGPAPAAAKIPVLILMAAISLGLIYGTTLGQKRAGRDLDDEQEATFRAAIAANPRNAAARCELARNLHRRGRLTEAIEELEAAIRLSPKSTEEEQQTLKLWLREQAGRPPSVVVCRWCREETPADRPDCRHCGRPLSAVREVADAVRSDIPGLIRGLLILCPILLLLAFLLMRLNGFAASLLMLMLVTTGLWWLRSHV